MNWEWTGSGQRCGSRRQDEHPGKISYYFNRSTSEGEYPLRPAGGVTSAWRAKDFHWDQEAANVDWEKREKERVNRVMRGKQKRKKRRIKEILILSERVLIFSSGLAMCAQPVISLETKKVECGESGCVCVLPSYTVCMCFCSAWEFMLPEWHHVCYHFGGFAQ